MMAYLDQYLRVDLFLLFLSSIFLPLPVCVAYIYNVIGGIVCSCLIIVASILSWWFKPDDPWRQFIESCIVKFTFIYHFILAIHGSVMVPYGVTWMFTSAVGLILYNKSVYMYQRGKFLQASFLHLGLHICSVLANSYLYIGVSRLKTRQKEE